MEFESDDFEKQYKYQGALLCGDWDGKLGKEIPKDAYLSGETIRAHSDKVNLQGMIAFFFACYGAGTPRYDEYYKQAFKDKGEIVAERPFIADLPKAMLSLQLSQSKI